MGGACRTKSLLEAVLTRQARSVVNTRGCSASGKGAAVSERTVKDTRTGALTWAKDNASRGGTGQPQYTMASLGLQEAGKIKIDLTGDGHR